MRDGGFRRVRLIEPSDLDELGHVNNLVWVRFVVELAFAHSASLGWDPDAYRRLGAWWIVHRQELDYHAPAFEGDAVEEATWIAEVRGARCVRESRFTRQGDRTPLLSSKTTWALVDAQSRRPRRVDRALAEAFPVLPSRGAR